MGYVKNTLCCGYGAKGTKTTGYDCVIIPGAMKADSVAPAALPNSVCGRDKGLVAASGTTPVTLCCT